MLEEHQSVFEYPVFESGSHREYGTIFDGSECVEHHLVFRLGGANTLRKCGVEGGEKQVSR